MSNLDRVDVLVQKYSLLRQEGWKYVDYYKSHVRNFQIIGGGLLAVVYYLVEKSVVPTAQTWWLWWGTCLLVSTVSNYLIMDVADALYALILLGQRMRVLEEQINASLGETLLVWETEVAPRFYSRLLPLPGVVNPNWLLGLFGALIGIAIAVAIPCVGFGMILSSGAARGSVAVIVTILGIATSAVLTVTSAGLLLRLALKTRGPVGRFMDGLRQGSTTPPAA